MVSPEPIFRDNTRGIKPVLLVRRIRHGEEGGLMAKEE